MIKTTFLGIRKKFDMSYEEAYMGLIFSEKGGINIL